MKEMTSGLILGKRTYSIQNVSKLCSSSRGLSLCQICLRESCAILFIWTVVRDWPSIFHWPSTYSVILLPLCYPFDFTRNNKNMSWGKMDTCICMVESLCYPNYLNIINLLYSIHNKMFKEKTNTVWSTSNIILSKHNNYLL